MRPSPWTMLVALGACSAPADVPGPVCDPLRGPPMARFADVTQDSGVRFEYTSDSFKGGGLAVADLDGDGRPEIVAGRRGGGLAMFRNLGSLRFAASTDDGLDATSAAAAIAAVDLDNDGDRDLVIAGARTARVMANQGDGRFVEAARLAGTGTTEHVLPVDLDGDGLLDLYLSNYDVTDATSSQNRVFLNRGGLQFTSAGDAGAGLSWTATALDFDGDGDQDLYIANDTLLADAGKPTPPQPAPWPVDLLLRNDGPDAEGTPRFTDLSADVGLDAPRSSMGGVLGDFNEDGALDLYVPNFGAKKLFLRDPAGGFVERAAELGVVATARINETCGPDAVTGSCLVLSWSAALSDFDLDGYDELLLVNGETIPLDDPPVILFSRGAELPYREVSTAIPCMNARGLVVTDLDGDGDQDVAIGQQEGPLVIYENRGTPAPASWLRVVLRGSASNREGVGAIVTVRLASGRVLTRPVGAGGVVHSASPAEALFGLGEGVEAVHVRWPSGRTSELLQPGPGTLVVDEPAR